MKTKFTMIFFALCIIIMSAYAQEPSSEITVSDDIQIFKLSDNIYLHRSYFQTENWGKVGANGLLVVKDNQALLIDTPWDNNQTEELFNWMKDYLNISITSAIVSHWHEDRMGGLDFLQSKGIKSYANQMTIDIANEKNLPVPDNGFTDFLTLDFHNIPIECYFLGGGHSTDNILVSLPSENILFGGCVIKDISATNLGNLADADVEAWPFTMEKIIYTFPEVQIVIPGHGAIGGTELLRHTQYLLENN